MPKYTAIIVDDEDANINLIRHFLFKFLPDIEPLGQANSVDDGVKIINNLKPDIVFLDIQLQESSAFDLLDCIDFIDIEIIFVTAYSNYAIKAFKYNAIDYIMKPINIDELIAAAKKCFQRIEDKKIFKKNFGAKEIVKSPINSDSISITSIDKVDILKKKDIVFCKSEGRYTIFYTTNNKEFVASKNLGEYELLLENDNFFRIHHSYIVNLSHLVQISKRAGYFCEMVNGAKLPIAKRRQDKLLIFINSKKRL